MKLKMSAGMDVSPHLATRRAPGLREPHLSRHPGGSGKLGSKIQNKIVIVASGFASRKGIRVVFSVNVVLDP